ncbi:MAG TPA: hypothetical protein VGF67_30595 [Ktedonobacteraceae bacterium]|jgi:hypothetical protein
MDEKQPQLSASQREFVDVVAKILKNQYRSLYEELLIGNKNPFFLKLAAQVGVAEDILLSEIVAHEVMNVLRDVEIEKNSREKPLAGLH